MRRSQPKAPLNELEANDTRFGEIAIGNSVTKHIYLSNRNPVQIAIRDYQSLVPNCALKLEAVEPIAYESELLTIAEGSKPPVKEKKHTNVGFGSRGLRYMLLAPSIACCCMCQHFRKPAFTII